MESVDVGVDGEASFQRFVTLRKRHGKCGSYTYNDGSLFIGNFDENGIKVCNVGLDIFF